VNEDFVGKFHIELSNTIHKRKIIIIQLNIIYNKIIAKTQMAYRF
jgi:hypothetical protein